MPRVKRGVPAHARHKKVLGLTKGQIGARHSRYRVAHEAMLHALSYSYQARRDRKGFFRRLWIIRINAALRPSGLSYSRFIAALKRRGIALNRKVLAGLALKEPDAFSRLVALAREAAPASKD